MPDPGPESDVGDADLLLQLAPQRLLVRLARLDAAAGRNQNCRNPGRAGSTSRTAS
jgi:hypothetical protein